MNQRLFQDRIAQLDGARFPTLDALLGQVDARIGHTVDSAAARAASPEDENGVLRADTVPYHLGLLPEADARHVDDDIPEVAFVEDNAARDGRDSDSVPVVADAGDDAAKEVFRMPRPARQLLHRVIERAEVKRVREGDRLRPHR